MTLHEIYDIQPEVPRGDKKDEPTPVAILKLAVASNIFAKAEVFPYLIALVGFVYGMNKDEANIAKYLLQ